MTKQERIANRPRDIAHCVSDYLGEGDLQGIASMFHPQCQIYFPRDAPPKIGHSGVEQAFAAFLKAPPTIESDVISEVIVGNVALLQARWRMVAGDGTVLAEGESMEVAQRLEHGGWVYLIDCPNGPPLLTGAEASLPT